MQQILIMSTCLVFGVITLSGQPVAEYNFDDCLLSDLSGNFEDAMTGGTLDCHCGVGFDSDALYFDGGPDTLFLDGALSEVLNTGDFSVGFYFWVEEAATSYSLISIRDGCDRDSSFIIQYLPSQDELILEFSRNIAEGVFFRTPLNSNNCWHHVMFTKEGELFALYLDGEFVTSAEFLTQIQVGPDYPITVGYSPCVGITDQFFEGRIDEIQFFDFALKEDEIKNILDFPDEIITMDTTIFQGDQLQVHAGSTCASSVSWTPVNGVSNTGITEPVLQPEETTLYEITFDHGSCRSVDSLLVSVISEEDIDCGSLLLPSAFTPNNDGLNDEYGISNAFIIEELQRFDIYNRWGMLLFSTGNKNAVWDGRFEGEFQGPGTYIYKIEYSCGGIDYSEAGSFNILR